MAPSGHRQHSGAALSSDALRTCGCGRVARAGHRHPGTQPCRKVHAGRRARSAWRGVLLRRACRSRRDRQGPPLSENSGTSRRRTEAARSPFGAGGRADRALADWPHRGRGLPARSHLASDRCPRCPSRVASHRWDGPRAPRDCKDATNRGSRRAHSSHAAWAAV